MKNECVIVNIARILFNTLRLITINYRREKFTTLTIADDARRCRNKMIQIILVYTAVPHVKVWRCAPSNETAVFSRVLLWTGLPLCFRRKRKEKKTSQKKTNSCSHLNKKCPVQFCFILKYICFIALRQHPVLAMKTRCWNVILFFCWDGNQRDPEQHT